MAALSIVLSIVSTPASTELCNAQLPTHTCLHEAMTANLTVTVTSGCDDVCHSPSRGHEPRSVSWLWSCSLQRVQCWGNTLGWR